MLRATRVTSLACAAAFSLGTSSLAQNAPAPLPVSAPLSKIAYRVTFDTAAAAQRMLHVAMSFETSGDAPVILSLPAWTPGAYELSYWARWLTNFAAAADGKPLGWDKVDYDTWRVRPDGARAVTVTFDYAADSLDNANSWAQRDFVLFNGTNLFLYPDGRGFDFPATVEVRTAPGWRIATGMTPAGAPNTFGAGNYHDLVDMPFFVGRFDLDSTRVGDGWIRFASYPAGAVGTNERAHVLAQLAKILPAEATVFGETPWRTYTVMQIADSAFGGIVGLEHQNSHVDVTSVFAVGQPLLTNVYAHEIFHAWNVKRLRPADLWPYQYAHEQPTTWLWMSEGITDYYADLSEVRAGVVDSVGFFGLTAAKMAEVANTRPVALEDASLNAWIHPVDGTYDTYYPKGSLAGLMLDVLIRDASDNRRSLDDVMRQLYRQDYKQGKGFTAPEWWSAVSAAAGGKSFDDFHARYIDGRDPYPWSTILPLAGLRLVVDTLRNPTLGLGTILDSAGLQVTSVEPGSTGAEAGVRVGDYLLSIGDIPVTERSFATRFRQKYRTEGAAVPITVQRGNEAVALSGKLRFEERMEMHVTADPKATPKAARIRAGILHGITEK